MSGQAAARAASAAASSGPLGSSIGQWAAIGLAGYAFASNGGERSPTDALREALRVALRLVGDSPADSPSPRPIVIHHGSPVPSSTVIWGQGGSFLSLLLASALFWGACAALSDLLPFVPGSVRSSLPVSRSLLDSAVSSLGRAVASVHESLSSKVAALCYRTDEITDQQNEMHGEVLAARSDLREVREEAGIVRGSLGRCESSLERAERRSLHTPRGVELLARCVRVVIPSNGGGGTMGGLAEELDEFGRTDAEGGGGKDDDGGLAHVSSRNLVLQRGSSDGLNSQRPAPPTPRNRPRRPLQRMDSVPERTENNDQPERTAAPPPTDRVDGLDEVRVLLLHPDRLS